jgi:uncharacterized small protein (DUF1192 family)
VTPFVPSLGEKERAMDWDETEKKPAKGVTVGESLETLSLAELEHRIEMLNSEIARVRTELERKRAHEAAASALFKK